MPQTGCSPPRGGKSPDADADVGRSAFEGIRQARGYYARLARRIREIDTAADSKHDVLDAIKRLNAGLELFAKGLRDDGSERGLNRVAEAADGTQEVAADLARATKALT